MADIVYILTNEAMPGLVKIGLTTADDVQARIAQLSSPSGVPLPFECHFAAEVKDGAKLEKTLHQLFVESRINPKREFFRLDPEKVVLAISIGEFKDVTPGTVLDEEQQQALDKARARRSRILLRTIGIKVGDTLNFSRDESITAIVTENNKVKFRGEVMSLSAAAVKSLHILGYTTQAASGSEFWMFRDETLNERRNRMEVEASDDYLDHDPTKEEIENSRKLEEIFYATEYDDDFDPDDVESDDYLRFAD